jgi:hypothetical protein
MCTHFAPGYYAAYSDSESEEGEFEDVIGGEAAGVRELYGSSGAAHLYHATRASADAGLRSLAYSLSQEFGGAGEALQGEVAAGRGGGGVPAGRNRVIPPGAGAQTGLAVAATLRRYNFFYKLGADEEGVLGERCAVVLEPLETYK